MKVKELILELIYHDPNAEIYFCNEEMDDNHWGCEVKIDGANGEDVSIVTTIEDER
tara:strand:- start:115 stop:282 length:168 start_codon:yes stop_codon:yes gene_type:complete